MEQRLIFYLLVLIALIPGPASAQQLNKGSNIKSGLSTRGDSIPAVKVSKAKHKSKAVSKTSLGLTKDTMVTVKLFPQTVDTELVQSRILLIDATLELNEALLQGVQASLDSLNVNEKSVINGKNIQATMRQMQRSRDKVLLTPFLLHMQDSLKTEVKEEKEEKAKLGAILNGAQPGIAKTEPAGMARDTLKKALMADTAHSVTWGNKNADSKKQVIESPVNSSANQTSVRQNKKPGKHDKNVLAAATVQNDNAELNREPMPVKPVIASGYSNQPNGNAPAVHWETAKALYYSDDTLSQDQNTNVVGTDAQFAQNSHDTLGYVPAGSNITAEGQPVMSDSLRITRAQIFLTKARRAGNEKNYKAAVEDLKKSIDLLPGYYDAWFALGEADAHLGFYTKALNEFKTCAKIDSSKASLFYKMGSIVLKLKQKEVAVVYFNKSLSLDSNYVPAIMFRASAYLEKKQYQTAVNEYARVLEIDRGYHQAYRLKGMAEYHLKNYIEAIDDFSRFLIFDRTDASAYYYRGLSKLDMDQLMDGCADLSFSAKLGYSAAEKALVTKCK